MSTEIVKQANVQKTKVTIIALDHKPVQYDKLKKTLRHAIKTGCWLVIENAHHIIEWPKEILNLLYV